MLKRIFRVSGTTVFFCSLYWLTRKDPTLIALIQYLCYVAAGWLVCDIIEYILTGKVEP